MKTSWVIGIVTLYLLIIGIELMASTGGSGGGGASLSSVNNTISENQSAFMTPPIANVGSGEYAVVKNTAAVWRYWLRVFTLTSPIMFEGYMVWLWWYTCFPIDCGMVVALIFFARGVHSG